MKKVVASLLFLMFLGLGTLSAQSEVSNSERLEQIEVEIDQAVAAGDYAKAAALKEERSIRLEIKKSVEAGDFEKAARLKDQLKSGGSGGNSNTINNNSGSTGSSGIRKETNRSRSRSNSSSPSRRGEHPMTDNGFYFDVLVGGGSTSAAYEYDLNSLSYGYDDFAVGSGVAFGVGLGNKFYFGSSSRDIRYGIDANWGALYFVLGDEVETVQFSFVNPGFSIVKAFSNDVALEGCMSIGPAVISSTTYSNPYSSSIYDSEYSSETAFGLAYAPRVKFRYKFLSAGIEYRYTSGFSVESYSSIFGLTFGMKF